MKFSVKVNKVLDEYWPSASYEDGKVLDYDELDLRKEMTTQALLKGLEKYNNTYEDIKSDFYIETEEHEEEFKAMFEEGKKPESWCLDLVMKESSAGGKIQWERCYDCRPYGSQLRMYVWTDAKDLEVLKINILAE